MDISDLLKRPGLCSLTDEHVEIGIISPETIHELTKWTSDASVYVSKSSLYTVYNKTGNCYFTFNPEMDDFYLNEALEIQCLINPHGDHTRIIKKFSPERGVYYEDHQNSRPTHICMQCMCSVSSLLAKKISDHFDEVTGESRPLVVKKNWAGRVRIRGENREN